MKLSAINLLEELDKPAFEGLRSKFSRRTYARGTIIYAPQEECNQVFVIAGGRVRIFLSYEEKEFTLAILDPGQVYATHTRAFVQAMEDCTLLVMDTLDFHAGLAAYPNLAGAVMTVLGGLLKNSFTIISGLVFKDANRRMVEHLLAAAEASRPQGQSGPVTIRLGLTIEQLAQIVGTTRQTASMLLNDLVRSGCLEKLERGTYKVPDLDRLFALLEE